MNPLKQINHSVDHYVWSTPEPDQKFSEQPETVSEFPEYLEIEITGRCNLMCTYCFRHSRKTEIGDMSFETFQKIIEEVKQYQAVSLKLQWMGESLLNPQFFKMVSHAMQNGIEAIEVCTNCTLLDEETSLMLLKSGVNNIICSLDFAKAETYDRLKVGGNYVQTIKNVDTLISLKQRHGVDHCRIVVQGLELDQTRDDIALFYDTWAEKADGVTIATFCRPDGNRNYRMRSKQAQADLFPCPYLWKSLVVAWDGTIYACTGNNACRDPMGRIGETRLIEIWKGDHLNKIRELHTSLQADEIKMCLHCDLNKLSDSQRN